MRNCVWSNFWSSKGSSSCGITKVSLLTPTRNKPKPGPVHQSTLHKFFGRSETISKSSGNVFISKQQCPVVVADRFTCAECSNRCMTKAALLSHSKTHKPVAVLGMEFIWMLAFSVFCFVCRLTEPTAESTKKRAVISGHKRRRFLQA